MDILGEFIKCNRDKFKVLDDAELGKLQGILLDMLKDCLEFCESRGLTCFLGGGSMLGAVRDKGIIPWDDDIDLVMPRSDYEVFKREYQAHCGGKYVVEAPNSPVRGSYCFMKIRRKDTVYRELITDDASCGVFIDIFPLENVSNNKFVRKVQTWFLSLIRDISYTVLYVKQYKRKIRPWLSSCPKKLRFQLWAGYFFGKILAIVPQRKWCDIYDSLARKGKPGKYVSIPVGLHSTEDETCPRDEFFPPASGEFNGLSVKLPGQYDKMLTRFYGDYMTPPPPEKRAVHYILEANLC